MVETGTILQNRYLIEKQIGEGGMGAVYLAVDQKFGSKVAIKETFYQEDGMGEAFEREARLLNGLHHPILPHVSDFFVENGRHFLLMEFIEGEDLSEILVREGAFPFENVLRWTNELLDALDYLHSHEPPIIHRDIKPNNLKLTLRGNIVLLDFGLAKLNTNKTMGMKSVFGYSRRYSPLEQIQGTGTDARSDIFALGATVYHLLTGKPPVDVLARASAIVSGKPDPLQLVSEINQQVPTAVAQVIQTALALNAERRFYSAKAMRKALEYALNLDAVLKEEELAEEVVLTDDSAKENSTPAENESFPALEAFVAEAVQKETGNSLPVLIDVPSAESPKPELKIKTKSEIPVKSEKLPRNSYTPFLAIAACLAVIFGGILGAWYSAPQAITSQESNQIPAVQASPTAETVTNEEPADVSISATPEVASTKPNRTVPQAKPKPSTQTKVTPEPEKTPVEIPTETAAAQKPIKRQNPTLAAARPAPAQTQPRRVSVPVPVNQPSVSSIETILTGIPTDRPAKPRRQMSEAEKEELRRRRTEDILRRNRPPR